MKTITITGANTFAEISNESWNSDSLTFVFPNSTTNVSRWRVFGRSATPVTLQRTGASGTFTLNYTGTENISSDYTTVSNGNAAPANTWYLGANSVNGGNTSGFLFSYGAVRYWVGGTGTWDATSIANWAYQSGYAGGAAAPTSLDDVYFDSGSDTGANFTVTVGTGAVCKTLNANTTSPLDFTMTLAGSAALSIYGSLYFPALRLSSTYTGTISFLSGTPDNIISTNGIIPTSGSINISGSGYFSLASHLNLSLANLSFGHIIISSGTFDTAGYNVTGIQLTTTGSTSRSILLRSSVVSLAYLNLLQATNLSFDPGTSTIDFSTNINGQYAGSLNLYNVRVNSTYGSTSFGQSFSILNNLVLGANVLSITFGSAGTYKIGNIVCGNSFTRPARFYGVSPQPSKTAIEITNSASGLSDIYFKDIDVIGDLAPITGTRLGDLGGNTGIAFQTKTVYWNLAGSQNWSAAAWALTSGGIPSLDNFPLPQDTCIFDDAGAAGTVTLNDYYHIGTIDFSRRNTAITIATGSNSPRFYKNVTLSPAVTVTGTGTWNFLGTSIQEITSSGRTITPAINVSGAGIKLVDAFSNSGNFTLTQGSLDLNEKTLTCGGEIFSLVSNGTLTRSINFGTNGFIYLTRQGANFLGDSISNFTATDTGGGLVFMNGGVHLVFGSNRSTDRSMAINVRVAPSSRWFNFEWQPSIVKNVTFDQGYTGVVNFRGCRVLGNLVFSPNMSVNATDLYSGILFQGETQTLKTNGVTVGCPIRIGFGWLGGTVSGIFPNLTILDDLNIVRSIDTAFGVSLFTIERGTLNLNGKKLTISANSFKPGFNSNFTSTRNLIFGGGSVEVQGSISPWTVASSNLNVTGPGTINMTSFSAKTFAGGSANYGGVILNQGGSGELTITGNNQFGGISNTVRPASIKFAAGSTTTLGKFMLNGSDEAPVTISSTTTGTTYTLTSSAGVFAPYYTNIQDSSATGGATWKAPVNYGNVNVSNNLGWDFTNINTLTDNFMVLFPSNLHLTS